MNPLAFWSHKTPPTAAKDKRRAAPVSGWEAATSESIHVGAKLEGEAAALAAIRDHRSIVYLAAVCTHSTEAHLSLPDVPSGPLFYNDSQSVDRRERCIRQRRIISPMWTAHNESKCIRMKARTRRTKPPACPRPLTSRPGASGAWRPWRGRGTRAGRRWCAARCGRSWSRRMTQKSWTASSSASRARRSSCARTCVDGCGWFVGSAWGSDCFARPQQIESIRNDLIGNQVI